MKLFGNFREGFGVGVSYPIENEFVVCPIEQEIVIYTKDRFILSGINVSK